MIGGGTLDGFKDDEPSMNIYKSNAGKGKGYG
jgi:hypothetical protein